MGTAWRYVCLGPNAPKIFSGSPYKLTKEEAKGFADFWTFFQGIRKSPPRRVEVALRRLNFAYERARPEDKLIDYLIGFEALLLQRSQRQELEYRLALRGSYLLADDFDERKTIFNELKAAYQERSNIVHGGSTKTTVKIGDQRVEFSKLVEKSEEHLRSTIRKFLELSVKQSEEQIIKDLDQKILRGS